MLSTSYLNYNYDKGFPSAVVYGSCINELGNKVNRAMGDPGSRRLSPIHPLAVSPIHQITPDYFKRSNSPSGLLQGIFDRFS
jgi:hypothetical protein